MSIVSSQSATAKPTARKSATTILPPAVTPAIKVELLPPAPNTLKESDSAKPVLHVDQAIVDAFLNAEGEVRAAAVMLFRACVARSVSPAQFVGRSDAKVRASEFNAAFRIGHLYGHDAARRIIDAAADQVGDKRANVLQALRKAKDLGEQVKRAALKGTALNKALTKAGDDVLAFASNEANYSKITKNRGAQLARIPKSDSMEAFRPVAMAALGDMLKSLGGIKLKAREIERVSALKSALEEAVDVLESMGKKE